MLFLQLGFLGMILTIAMCRKPGVKFFSRISVFNRKEKLTQTGATLLLISFGLGAIGVILKIISMMNH
jgi:hypothetical protein